MPCRNLPVFQKPLTPPSLAASLWSSENKGQVFSAFLLTPVFDRPDASHPDFLARGWLMYTETGMYFMTFLHCYYLLIYSLHKTDNCFFVCSAHPESCTFPLGKRISPSYSTCSNDQAALGVTELNCPLVVVWEGHYYLHSKVRSFSCVN